MLLQVLRRANTVFIQNNNGKIYVSESHVIFCLPDSKVKKVLASLKVPYPEVGKCYIRENKKTEWKERKPFDFEKFFKFTAMKAVFEGIERPWQSGTLKPAALASGEIAYFNKDYIQALYECEGTKKQAYCNSPESPLVYGNSVVLPVIIGPENKKAAVSKNSKPAKAENIPEATTKQPESEVNDIMKEKEKNVKSATSTGKKELAIDTIKALKDDPEWKVTAWALLSGTASNKNLIMSAGIDADIFTVNDFIGFELTGEMPNYHTFEVWKSAGYAVKKGEKAAFKCDIWKQITKRQTLTEEEAKNMNMLVVGAAYKAGDTIDDSKYIMKTAFFFGEKQVEKLNYKAINLPNDCKIEVKNGLEIVTGNTKPIKDSLKAAGYQWHFKDKVWYKKAKNTVEPEPAKAPLRSWNEILTVLPPTPICIEMKNDIETRIKAEIDALKTDENFEMLRDRALTALRQRLNEYVAFIKSHKAAEKYLNVLNDNAVWNIKAAQKMLGGERKYYRARFTMVKNNEGYWYSTDHPDRIVASQYSYHEIKIITKEGTKRYDKAATLAANEATIKEYTRCLEKLEQDILNIPIALKIKKHMLEEAKQLDRYKYSCSDLKLNFNEYRAFNY